MILHRNSPYLSELGDITHFHVDHRPRGRDRGESPTILALTYSNASVQGLGLLVCARKSEQPGHELAQPGCFLPEMNEAGI